jgi:hypothetical protein
VSASPQDLESRPAAAHGPRSTDPFQNPTYLVRDHFLERAELEQTVQACSERINSARQKLESVAKHPQKASLVRLYFQMLGARDQLAESARRMPLETGTLYHEDKERYEQAKAALDRLWRNWDKVVP